MLWADGRTHPENRATTPVNAPTLGLQNVPVSHGPALPSLAVISGAGPQSGADTAVLYCSGMEVTYGLVFRA